MGELRRIDLREKPQYEAPTLTDLSRSRVASEQKTATQWRDVPEGILKQPSVKS